MRRPDRPRVLALGVDAAEPRAIASLMARGDLPNLRGLRDAAGWSAVTSPADLGSGAVWPTFMTGTLPARHQINSFWVWRPELMDVRPLVPERMTPFWASLADGGGRVAVLDVPFAPVVRRPGLVVIDEWGAHDPVRGSLEVWPPELEAMVRSVDRSAGPHPFSAPHLSPDVPNDPTELAALASACRSGLRRRADLVLRIMAEHAPDVLLAVFPEVHRASHYLWHTLDGAHRDVEPRDREDGGSVDLPTIFRELDRQIGRLVETAGPETTVVIFSLHGMRPTRGVPSLLGPLLQDAGLARNLPWRARSALGRLRGAVGLARRLVPQSFKRHYHRLAGKSLVDRVALQTTLPAYDWSGTAAFPLPTDQHGALRVNLAGREAHGLVARSDYEPMCRRLEQMVRGLRTASGEPLVRAVLSTAAAQGGAPPDNLPDLIVHWEDAACVPELELASPPLVCPASLRQMTGQHSADGFCLVRPARGTTVDRADTVAVSDLHRLIAVAASGRAL